MAQALKALYEEMKASAEAFRKAQETYFKASENSDRNWAAYADAYEAHQQAYNAGIIAETAYFSALKGPPQTE